MATQYPLTTRMRLPGSSGIMGTAVRYRWARRHHGYEQEGRFKGRQAAAEPQGIQVGQECVRKRSVTAEASDEGEVAAGRRSAASPCCLADNPLEPRPPRLVSSASVALAYTGRYELLVNRQNPRLVSKQEHAYDHVR